LAVAVCVPDPRRRRIETALEGVAAVRAHQTFDSLALSMEADGFSSVVIVGPRDATGAAPWSLASRIVARAPEVSLILYASYEETTRGVLEPGTFCDLIVADETDGRTHVQRLVLNAANRRAADRVARALRGRLSSNLASFAETAVRFPSRVSVEAISDHFGVHRQTAAVWCRKEKCIHPEELIIWSRLLLVAALLEQTDRSLAAVSIDLDYPSTVGADQRISAELTAAG
jgi:hypothetical protein